jgi:hypothetical protein
MQPVQLHSTSLQAVAYQEQLGLLELEFRNGAVYHYFDVSESTYQALLRAESKGRHFNHYIRNRFAYARIRAAGPSHS